MFSNRLTTLMAIIYAIGAVWRFVYMLHVHPMTDFIYSDMNFYFHDALSFFSGRPETIADTVHPLGTSFFFAILHRIDPSWRLAYCTQAVLSSAVPLLLGWTANALFSFPVGVLTVIAASLYFPYVNYAGYFLAENPFTFFLCLAMALFIQTLQRRSSAWAFAAGLAAGCAASFKSVGLAFGGMIALTALALHGRDERRHVGWILAVAMAGAAVVIAPQAIRTTRLSEGRPSLLDNNFNGIAVNRSDGACTVRFEDRKRGFNFEFGSPAINHLGCHGTRTLPFGAYDTPAVLRYAWRELFLKHPLSYLASSLRQVAFLFHGGPLWPGGYEPKSGWLKWSQRLVVVFCFLPAAFRLCRRWPTIATLSRDALPEALLTAPLLALIGIVFLVAGEPRYRIPLDGFLMILASAEAVEWLPVLWAVLKEKYKRRRRV